MHGLREDWEPVDMIPFFDPVIAAAVYTVLLALGVTVVKARGGEHDDGNYRDSFRTFWETPYDKAIHAGACFGLMLGAVWLLGCDVWAAAGLTMIVGAVWELIFGYVSWRDGVADLLGTALAVLWIIVGARAV